MNKLRSIGDGISTAPDVRKIRDRYPDSQLVEGKTEIPKEEIASLLYVDEYSARFRTVTNAWRKQVQKDSSKIIALRDGKFIVLDDSGKLGVVKSDLSQAGKKIRRARERGSLIVRQNLSPDELAQYDRTNYRMSKIMEADRLAAKAEVPALA